MKKKSFDPVTLEIYRALFTSIAEEMGIALRRTAFSPNIKERRDYSCAIFNQRGEVIAQGDHMPVHLGSMPMAVAAALTKQIGPGDVVALNDPFSGGTHLPDVTLVAGVFNKTRPIFYVANRAHHADIGGASPGSMGIGLDIYSEGLRIPAVHLVKGGEICEDVMNILLSNMRAAKERRADFEAQIGSLNKGINRLNEICADRQSEVLEYADHLIVYSERVMRSTLRGLKNGTYRAQDHLDDDGAGNSTIPIKVSITKKNDHVTVDFTGSSPQVAGPVNAVEAITVSAVSYVFRCLIKEAEVPASAGLMRPIKVIAPRGTVVNALPPAAVAGGNVETSQRIVDVLLRALSYVGREIPAASQGTMNNLTIGGIDFNGHEFSYYETVAGGMGARPGQDGLDAVHTHMTNSLNTPAEALEYAYPLRVHRYEIRKGSGGRGRQRGGDGIVREIEVLVPATISLLSERRRSRPYGLNGGDDGEAGRDVIIRRGRKVGIESKGSWKLEKGNVVRIETPGGGGFGKYRNEGNNRSDKHNKRRP
jgi:N-methylhydantoinase B